MTTKAIMTRELVTLPPTATVAEALWLMHERHMRSLPVVDENGCFLGLFGVRRLTRLLLPKATAIGLAGLIDLSFMPDEEEKLSKRLRAAGKRPISEFLEKKKKLLFCGPDTPFPKLLRLLEESKDSSLPVIIVAGDDMKLVGVVSAWDVLERLALAMLNGSEQEVPAADSAPAGPDEAEKD